MTSFKTQMNYAADHLLPNGPKSKHDLVSAVKDSPHALWLIVPSSDGAEQFHVIADDQTAHFDVRGPNQVWYVDLTNRDESPTQRADGYARGRWDVISLREGDI